MSEHEKYLSSLSLVSLKDLQEQVKLRIREVAELESSIKVGDVVRVLEKRARDVYLLGRPNKIGIVVKVNKRKYRVLFYDFMLEAETCRLHGTDGWKYFYTGNVDRRFSVRYEDVNKELVSLYDSVKPDDYKYVGRHPFSNFSEVVMDMLETCKTSREYGLQLHDWKWNTPPSERFMPRSYNPREPIWKEHKEILLTSLDQLLLQDAYGKYWPKNWASKEWKENATSFCLRYHEVMRELLEEITGVEE